VCNGLLARLATSSSAIVVELGGWDHLWAEGEGCREEIEDCAKVLDVYNCFNCPLQDRNGLAKVFMVAFGGWVVG